MYMELVNFGVFLVLVSAFHVGHKKLDHRRERPERRFKTRHFAFIAGVISHPTVWEAVQHYVIHLVVYSGHILPLH